MTQSNSPTYLSFANTYTGAPYSHVVEFGRILWLTGRTAKNPDDVTAPLPEGIEAQTHATMENVARLLADAGATLHDVVQARVFLTEFHRDFAAMNEVYKAYFKPGRLPARTCVGTTGLGFEDALIEIEVMAVRSATESATQ